MSDGKKVVTVEAYINQFDENTQKLLEKVRKIIKEEAPDAKEKISWAMPTYHQGENLIHFAAHKQHLGIYPGAEAMEYYLELFEEKGYKYSKGAVQFPYKQELPEELLREIVRFRVKVCKEKETK